MDMNGYDCYRFYIAVKTHFAQNNYDCFKANCKTKTSVSMYNKRRDFKKFEYIASKFTHIPTYIQYVACNFMYGNPNFLYQDFQESYINLKEYTKRKESITNVFSEDISKIETINFDTCFQLYTKNLIRLESLVILDSLENFSSNNLFLEDTIKLIKKSRGFVIFNPRKIYTIYINHLKENTFSGQNV